MAKRRRKRKKGVQAPATRPAVPACAACGEAVAGAPDAQPCPACGATHHPACWTKAGRCAACGRKPAAVPGWLARLSGELVAQGSAAVLLVALAVAVYLNSLTVPFLFDDAPVITRNPLLWEWHELEHWTRLFMWNPLRGLTNLTFLVNFQLAGTPTVVGTYTTGDYVPYHVVNIAIHAANAILLYLLLRALLRARAELVPPGAAPWVALIGAAVWAVHPAHTMAVSYIAQRYALMAALAFLGTLVLYTRLRLRMRETGADPVPLAGHLGAVVLAALVTALLFSLKLAVLVVAPLGMGIALWRLWSRSSQLGWHFLGLLGAVAASLACAFTKENATVIPVAIVLVEVLFFARSPQRSTDDEAGDWTRALRGVPLALVFFLPFAAGALVRLDMLGLLGNISFFGAAEKGEKGLLEVLDAFFPSRSPTANRWQYFTSQVYVVPRYLHLFLLPYDLSVEQNFPALWGAERVAALGAWLKGEGALAGDDLRYVGAVGVHLLLWTLAIKLLARGQRFIPLAIVWFYLCNLVESSFVPILDPMVDHRMYLPTALLPAAFAVACARLWPRIAAGRPSAWLGAAGAAAALVLALGVGTVVRNTVWSSSLGIWQDTVAKRPNCARAYSSLGMEHLYRGEWMEAIAPIEAALYLGPYHVEGWNNLGKAYLELQRWREAERALQRGIEVNQVAPSPSVPLCWNNLGLVYIQVAQETPDRDRRIQLLTNAVEKLRQATALDPNYEVAWINLSTAEFRLLALSTGAERVAHAKQAVRAAGQAEAVAARRGGVLPGLTYRNWALALCEAGQSLEALEAVRELLERFPPAEHATLAEDAARIALQTHGEGREDAAAVVAEAIRLVDAIRGRLTDPPGTLLTLRGRLADVAGDIPAAVSFLRAGLAKAPDQPQAAVMAERLRELEQKTVVPPERAD